MTPTACESNSICVHDSTSHLILGLGHPASCLRPHHFGAKHFTPRSVYLESFFTRFYLLRGEDQKKVKWRSTPFGPIEHPHGRWYGDVEEAVMQ
jgi:hypothetical protein